MGWQERQVVGERLRTERVRRRWPRSALAREIQAQLPDKQYPSIDVLISYIKRWETGVTGVSARYQLACAAAFGIDPDDLFGLPPGLKLLPPAAPPPVTAPAPPGTVDDYLGILGEEDETERRRLLLSALGLGAGAASSPLLAGLDPSRQERLAWARHNPARIDAAAVESLADVLATTRRAEDTLGSAIMLGPAFAQLRVVEDLVRHAPDTVRPRLLNVAQQWAQYAGWLCRNTLDTRRANACLARTLEWATEIGDHTMISSVLSEKSWMASSADQPGPAISLAQAARQDVRTATEQLTRTAVFEASAHAMTGDTAATDRKLSDARALAAVLSDEPGKRRPWLYWVTPGWLQNEAGIACSYLAADPYWHARAVTALETTGSDGLWASARNLTFLAAAHAKAGDVGSACAAGLKAATAIRTSGSQRCTARLTQVCTELSARHRGDPRVADLADALR
jgi:transcriptional regulator with XRE-family HTH domain